MGHEPGKLTVLAYLLVKHGPAVEADLFPDADLLDLYRPEAALTLRRVWVLVSGRLLIETGDFTFAPVPGTALARSISGELGDWSRLDRLVAGALGGKLPEDKTVRQWKAANQKRLAEKRAERERLKEAGAL